MSLNDYFYINFVLSYYGDIPVGLEFTDWWLIVLCLCRWSAFWMCYTLFWGVLLIHVSRLWRFFWSEGWSSSTVCCSNTTLETRLVRDYSGWDLNGSKIIKAHFEMHYWKHHGEISFFQCEMSTSLLLFCRSCIKSWRVSVYLSAINCASNLRNPVTLGWSVPLETFPSPWQLCAVCMSRCSPQVNWRKGGQ